MATAPTVTLKQLAANLADKHDMTKKDVEALLEDLEDNIVSNLQGGTRVRFKKLGILQVKQMKARTGRNPQTGETIQIPARKKVGFTVAKALKEAVL